MVHRDPDTGKFVSDGESSHTMMADGGLPQGIIEEVYYGNGAYTDVEQIGFMVEVGDDSPSSNGQQEAFNADGVIDPADFLDRREEQADLIYADVQVMSMAVVEDDAVFATQRDYAAYTTITTGDNDPGVGAIDFPSGVSDEVNQNTVNTVDLIGRQLLTGANTGYEDGANSAGGGGWAAWDGWEGMGHELTADPTFEERDQINVETFITSDREVDAVVRIAGNFLFGLYELTQPEVRR